jgi:thiol-disulfide isomerase/thioredoxin
MKKILNKTVSFCYLSLAICLAHASTEQRLIPLNGGPEFGLDGLKGKPVLINFWASWCGPCVSEIRTLNRFYHDYHDQIHLYAVNMDEVNPAEQTHLAESFHLSYPSLDAQSAKKFIQQELTAIPATFVFDQEGQLQTVLYGELNTYALKRIIRQMPTKTVSSRQASNQ